MDEPDWGALWSVELQIETNIDYEPLHWVPIFRATGDTAEQDVLNYASALLHGFDTIAPTRIKSFQPRLRAVDQRGKTVAEWDMEAFR